MSDEEFDLKKKKKKSKKVDFDAFEEDAAGGNDDDGVAATAEKIEDLDLEEFGKKKKSKKKKKLALSDDEEGENDDENATTSSGGGGVQSGLGLPWDGSDRDYHYDELLGRVFGILKEKNPALSEKTKTIIKPPQIAREGTKKTVFANLMEICNAMHRPHEHVTQYMMAELGTTGTLDGQQRLIIKGRFLPKVFEGVLRHYFIDYVICNMCKSSDTQLVKEATTRLSYCRCQSCGASRSVSNIQKGYTAVGRGERRKARAMGT